jgi:hypothetical protein
MQNPLAVLLLAILALGCACGSEKAASDAAEKASPRKVLKSKPVEDYKGALKDLDDKAQAIKDKAIDEMDKEAN